MRTSSTLAVLLLLVAALGAFVASAAAPSTPQAFRKPSRETLKRTLTPEQFRITQEDGTERPFQNAYWNHKAEGLYVDVVSGEPLFSSLDKFDSGTGWPSFTRPLVKANVKEKRDVSGFMVRTEVRSARADSHLGHVFDDGPEDRGGLRYCINSAALRFVPAAKLAEEGYAQFAPLFGPLPQPAPDPSREVAVLAGGCFWGMEDLLRKIPGVVETDVGYAGGLVERPTYAQVSSGATGAAEAVRIVFDPAKVSYAELLGHFFRIHDPTTKDRQGNDVGSQYRSAIFAQSDAQAQVAAEVRAKVDASGKWKRPLVTEIIRSDCFHPAEERHQDYLVKNPNGYTCHYYRD